MKIKFTEEAKNALENRRVKNLSIYTEMPIGCWSLQKPDVFVRLRKPNNMDGYDKYEVDGINVYIQKTAAHDEEVTIKLAEYYTELANKEFWVDGIY